MLLGNGDGTFQAAQNFATANPTFVGHVAVADFNGDGKPDLVTANSASHNGSTASACFWATATAPSAPLRTTRAGSSPCPSSRATSTATAGPTSPWPTTIQRRLGAAQRRATGRPLPPSLRINDVTVTEGNTGTVNGDLHRHAVRRLRTETITVTLRHRQRHRHAGSDYTGRRPAR